MGGYSGYYGYGMGGSPLNSLLQAGTAFTVLSIVAFIASIVCTVIVYKKYVSTADAYSRVNRDKQETLRSFLRFDTLIIEKILKAFYLFGAISTVFFALAFLISSLFVSAGAFGGTLIAVIIIVPISELVHRVVYEFVMLNIVIARNSTEIKNMMQGNNPQANSTPTQSTPTQGTPMQGTPGNVASPSPNYSAVGGAAVSQSVCPHCGNPLKPGQKFCGVCGNSLG